MRASEFFYTQHERGFLLHSLHGNPGFYNKYDGAVKKHRKSYDLKHHWYPVICRTRQYDTAYSHTCTYKQTQGNIKYRHCFLQKPGSP